MTSTAFEAERAALKAALAGTVLHGGDATKIRAKLDALDAREQAAQAAEAHRQEQDRQARSEAAQERGRLLADEAIARLQAHGVDPSAGDKARLLVQARMLAGLDQEVEAAEAKRGEHFAEVALVEARLAAVRGRSEALSNLRVAGGGTQQDAAEIVALQADAAVLDTMLRDAQRKAAGVVVPPDLQRQRDIVKTGLAELERSLRVDAQRDRIGALEASLLREIAALMALTHSRLASECYRPSIQLDRLIRLGALLP